METEVSIGGAVGMDAAPAWVWELLVCPACHGSLTWTPTAGRCTACAARYEVNDGIPVLLALPAEADEVGTRPPLGDAHKAQQAKFFDEDVDMEYEITRPHGTPRFFHWLLDEKFRVALRGIEHWLPGATALTVAGGSGMDAEYLARAGARVISSDLSLQAARRARERARRSGLAIFPIVADLERLPFADRGIDLVFVHDGLHHLERPLDGISEMSRVARRVLAVNEPVRAQATAIAVRLRLSVSREEAGNVVMRLDPGEVVARAGAEGFDAYRVRRYAMLYKHEPGPVMRFFSLPVVFGLAQIGFRATNRLIGRYGNKLSLVAVRDAAGRTAGRPPL
jgi:SAM-dependent methyltransferase/uncharacterized protein YbaR (Trm112 family)